MSLTARQQAIYDFIVELLALEAKGYIRRSRRGSRQVDVVKENPALAQHSALFNLPVFTSVPGEADAPLTARGAEACVTLDRSALGFRPRPGTFVLKVHGDAMKQAGISDGLKVHGDAMKQAGISDGDLVIVEPCQEAQAGQIVAATVAGNTLLRRLSRSRGRWLLKSENRARPEATPRSEAVIRGVARLVLHRLD